MHSVIFRTSLLIKNRLIFGQFSNPSWSKKGHEPSWKTFSSSYGSSQLGSDSSLLASFCRIYILSSDSDIYVKKISEMRTSSKYQKRQKHEQIFKMSLKKYWTNNIRFAYNVWIFPNKHENNLTVDKDCA